MAHDARRLRLGGMALANGLLVHGAHHWAAAVVADDGRTIVASGERPRISASRFDRLPLARGIIRMAEAMMVVPVARRGLPEARTAMEDRPMGVVIVAAMIGSTIVRRRIRSVAAQEAVAAVLGLVPALIALRTSDAAIWHGVEHKSIAAYERGGEEGMATSGTDAKEHSRCGSNLVLPLLVTTAVGNALSRRITGTRWRIVARAGVLALGVGASVEAFAFAERHPGHPLARMIHGAGHAIQLGFVTREPGDAELAVGRAAMQEIIRVEAAPVPA